MPTSPQSNLTNRQQNDLENSLMVGNDVVDLSICNDIIPNWKTRFMKRVFTESECEIIQSRLNWRSILWSLWAAKEAAYKAFKRYQTNLAFDYKQFVVSEDLRTVSVFGESIDLSVVSHNHYVHAVVYRGASPLRVVWAVETHDRIPDDESSAVRETLKRNLINKIPSGIREGLFISPTDGCPPSVLWGESREERPLSLSHDGKYTAFATII